MKTTFKIEEHSQRPGEMTVKVMHNGELIGVIFGLEGPGFKLITKHTTEVHNLFGGGLSVDEIVIDPTRIA